MTRDAGLSPQAPVLSSRSPRRTKARFGTAAPPKAGWKKEHGPHRGRGLYACVTHWPAFHIAALRHPRTCSCDPNQRGHGMLSDILFILGGLAVFLLAGLAVRGADRL